MFDKEGRQLEALTPYVCEHLASLDTLAATAGVQAAAADSPRGARPAPPDSAHARGDTSPRPPAVRPANAAPRP